MNTDAPTLVKFYSGWERDGIGPDGLPLFRSTVRIRLDRPPYLSVEREAEQADIDNHPEPYALYQRVEDAKTETAGYPLVMWPPCLPHLFQMCAARDIVTVEQLAQLVAKKRRSETEKHVPPDIVELADRAARLVELQTKQGQYEEIVTDLTGQIGVLREQVEDAMKTIAAQKETINALRLKAAA